MNKEKRKEEDENEEDEEAEDGLKRKNEMKKNAKRWMGSVSDLSSLSLGI